jgi:hypothetical protein
MGNIEGIAGMDVYGRGCIQSGRAGSLTATIDSIEESATFQARPPTCPHDEHERLRADVADYKQAAEVLRDEVKRLRAVIDEMAGVLLRARLVPDDMGGQVEDGSG